MAVLIDQVPTETWKGRMADAEYFNVRAQAVLRFYEALRSINFGHDDAVIITAGQQFLENIKC
jgi:hypothetical protein